jgi:hypothetical protein
MITRKVGPGHRGGLHGRAEAIRTDALFRARPCACWRGSRPAARRVQYRDGRCRTDRPRPDRRPARRQVHLHRLDSGRQEAGRAVCMGQSSACRWSWAATRPSWFSTTPISKPPSSRRHHGVQVPQHGPDLRLRQPHLRAGRVYDAVRQAGWPRRPRAL